jgi:four helix bundle protein
MKTYTSEDFRHETDEHLFVVAEPDGRSIKHYRELWVWLRSMELVTDVYQITSKLPKDELYGLTSQLRRAAVSVPSNIAEGWARNKPGYLVQGLNYSRGSLHEVETQLLICIALDYCSAQDVQPTLNKIAGISAGIGKFILNLETRH